MITYVVTDLFQSPARVLVNTVNTVGVMGAGIAKEFKRIYPDMFTQYQTICEREQLDIGQLWLYKTSHKWIINFPTKKHWRQPSRPQYIEAGLKKFQEIFAEQGITSISFPLLGCGNGELDWETQVKPIMERYLKPIPIEAFIHLHRRDPFVPEHRHPDIIKAWLRSEPESLPFAEVWDDLLTKIREEGTFKFLDSTETFTAKATISPQDGIEIEVAGGSVFVAKDALFDVWQHLRGFGFCMERHMPSGLDRYTRYIVALMATLSYLKPVLLSRDYSKVTRKAVGLQLLPRARKPEGPLFAHTKILEPA